MKTNRTTAGSQFQEQILDLLENVSEVETSGIKFVEGNPSPAFWTLWNERKNVVKAADFTVCKTDAGQWWVTIKVSNLSEEMTLETCLSIAKATAQEKGFWQNPKNWHLIPTE